MPSDESPNELQALVWRHISRREFAQAEVLVGRSIDDTDPADCLLLWHRFSVLASVLTELQRPREATEMLRRALSEARRAGPSAPVDEARYMLAHHCFVHGDPRDVLSEAQPVPSGEGHIQCLLHEVVALAHRKLGHEVEARAAAVRAIAAAPTEDRKRSSSEALREILSAG